MIFIMTEKIKETKEKVILIHNYPQNLKEDHIKRGRLVTTIPDAKTIEGKQSILYFNPVDESFWHEYIGAKCFSISA